MRFTRVPVVLVVRATASGLTVKDDLIPWPLGFRGAPRTLVNIPRFCALRWYRLLLFRLAPRLDGATDLKWYRSAMFLWRCACSERGRPPARREDIKHRGLFLLLCNRESDVHLPVGPPEIQVEAGNRCLR